MKYHALQNNLYIIKTVAYNLSVFAYSLLSQLAKPWSYFGISTCWDFFLQLITWVQYSKLSPLRLRTRDPPPMPCLFGFMLNLTGTCNHLVVLIGFHNPTFKRSMSFDYNRISPHNVIKRLQSLAGWLAFVSKNFEIKQSTVVKEESELSMQLLTL